MLLDKPSKQNISDLILLFKKRLGLSLLLSLTILASIVLESIGFGMILPVLEALIGQGAPTFLGEVFRDLYAFLGIEMTLMNVIVLFAIVMLLKNVLIVLREALRSYFAYSFKRDAMLGINESLFRMHYEDFSKERQGHLINDVVTETQHATLALLQSIEFVISFIAIIAFLVVMFMANPVVTGWLTVIAAIFVGGSKYSLGKYSKKVGLKEVSLNQSVTDQLAESVTLMRDFRLYLLENFHLTRIKKTLSKLIRLLVRWDIMTAAIMPIIELVIVLGFSIYLGYMVIEGKSGSFIDVLPSISVILVLAHRMLQRVSRLSVTYLAVSKYLPSFYTVLKYYNKHDVQEKTAVGDDLIGDVEFHDVSIRLPGGKTVVKNVNMTLPSGRATALIGESGSGKSTLIDAMIRLRRIDTGRIFVNGKDLSQYSDDFIRSRISVISQSTVLRNDSVLNNILSGDMSARDEDVINLCRALDIDGFIRALPDGYNTIVGDRGGLLSGGQVQRIVIARALLRKPDILIMDEATSALDKDTEASVNEKIMSFMKGKTVLVVTHQAAILEYCSKFYRVEDGSVRES